MSVYVDPDDLVEVEISAKWGENPLTTTGTWVDISEYVRKWSTRRGKSSPLGPYQPGRLQLTLDNTDGRFDPTYVSGAYYPDVKPLVQMRVQARYNAGTWRPIWYGFAESYSQRYQRFVDQTVDVVAVDGFKILSLLSTTTLENQENTGTRIGNLLDYAGWPSAWRVIGTGDVTAEDHQTQCQTLTQLIRQIEDTEAGWFFMGNSGYATFRAQSYRAGLTVEATFGDSGSEIRYSNIDIMTDDAEIRNNVQVSRIGGTAQTSDDATSQTDYGIRTLKQLDLPLTSDANALTLAGVLKTRYASPLTRIQSVSVPVFADVTNLDTLLLLELCDKATVIRRPSYGTISQNVYVEGISHRAVPSQRQWSIDFALSQEE